MSVPNHRTATSDGAAPPDLEAQLDELQRRNEALHERLRQAEETIQVLRKGPVDAVVRTLNRGDEAFRQRAEDVARQADAALSYSHHLLHGLIEGTRDLIASLDLDMRFTAFNRAYADEFRRLFRRDIEVGTSLKEALAHLPIEQAKVLAPWGRALRGEEFTAVEEFGSEQSLSFLESRYSPIRNTQGQLIGAAHIVRDVTSRVTAENALMQSKATLERRVQQRTSELARANRATTESLALVDTLLMKAPVGLGFFDRELRFVKLNHTLAAMTARPIGEHIGKPLPEIVPQLPADLLDKLRSVLSAGQPVIDLDMALASPRPDGGLRHYLVSGYPVRLGTEGELIGLGVVLLDITDRRRSVEVLRRQNDRLRLLSEAAGDLLGGDEPATLIPGLFAKIADHLGLDIYLSYTLDASGEHLELESSAGVPDEEAKAMARRALGQHFIGTSALLREPLVAADIQTAGDPLAGPLRDTGARACVCTPLLVGDRLLGSLTFASRQRDRFTAEEVDFLQAICHSVAMARERSRLMAEVTLRAAAFARSEAYFRELADSMPQMVWACVPTGLNDYWNSPAAAYFGLPLDELGGDGWRQVVHPEDLPRTDTLWRKAVQSGLSYEIEYRLRLADGNYRWHLGRGRPVRDEAGRVLRWFGTCTDIDDQKRAVAALKEADQRKDEFLAMLAHELRNPLAPIRNCVLLMQRMGIDSALRPSLDIIDRQVQQLSRLVDDLLDVSRITRGKIKLQREPVEILAVIARAVETSRPLVDSRRHTLTVSLPDETIRVLGDITRLAQVFANLLNNSAKYSEEGGRIWLTARHERDEIVVRVRDTGVGIPPEVLPRVFDLFTQAERSLDRSQGGLGIGLSLVRSLVELHGGSVQAFSEGVGQGSEFVVRLPVLAASPRSHPELLLPETADEEELVNGSHRVLVVDDNVDSAESLALLLRMTGHQVRTAYDGPAALEAARTFRPGVVLCDIGLPGMDGYEVARRLRKTPELNKALLVALTGYGQQEDRRKSQGAGFDAHFVKPVDPVALEELLQQSLDTDTPSAPGS